MNSGFAIFNSLSSLLCAGVLLLPSAEPLEQDPDLAFAEQALHNAGASIDGPGILAFIRARTTTAEQRRELIGKVRALGSAEFKEREKAMRQLIAVGRPALPYLRPAVEDSDLELSRRARRCIELIQRRKDPSFMALAALLLKARRPDGTVPALLDYLPNVADEALEETWLDTLRACGWRETQPDPALLAALTDKRPLRRAAAAHVLGRGSVASVRERVVPLLADTDARVRFEAAAALVASGETKAVRVLMTLLTDGPFTLACRSEHLLHVLADGPGVQACLDKDDASLRRLCRTAWESWWDKHAGRVDLTRLRRMPLPRGRTLVCEDSAEGGRVWEWGESGQPYWQIVSSDGPHDVQALPGGRILIAEHHANRVTERDHAGKIRWDYQTSVNPVACRRLPNGNTLIATYHELFEVTREQRKVFRHFDRRDFRDALALPNGHILYVTGDGSLVEFDARLDHTVHVIRPAQFADGAKYRARVEALVNGRYLLTLGGANRVIELDQAGKIHWQCTVNSPMSATRLPNGHTLIASFEQRCVIEVDRSSKEVSRQTLQGRPYVIARY
jgi:hypothetical protein